LKEVAQAKGTDPARQLNFNNWDLSLLTDYIVQHHHSYVRQAIPQIKDLLKKVCEVHGDDSPNVLIIRDAFNMLAYELLNHLPKEEEILFPAIKKLASGKYDLTSPMDVMEDEHERAGELLKNIREESGEYNPPVFACPTYKMTYIMLKQFDEDLTQHIHLENNILFPKVRKLASHK
jgi:regulator of cell morphogenesis and NO signaling